MSNLDVYKELLEMACRVGKITDSSFSDNGNMNVEGTIHGSNKEFHFFTMDKPANGNQEGASE